jgi:hypothetical protein
MYEQPLKKEKKKKSTEETEKLYNKNPLKVLIRK